MILQFWFSPMDLEAETGGKSDEGEGETILPKHKYKNSIWLEQNSLPPPLSTFYGGRCTTVNSHEFQPELGGGEFYLLVQIVVLDWPFDQTQRMFTKGDRGGQLKLPNLARLAKI